MTATDLTPWQIFLKGGPVMWPILLCSIMSLAIVIDKFLFFHSIREDVAQLKKNIFDALKKNDIQKAVKLCDASSSPSAKVMKAGVLKFGRNKDEIKEAIEDVSQFEVPRLERRLQALATIGNVSPLLGLLGTVTGMTASFHMIQVRAAAMNPVTPGDIAGGIWEALITTVAGLVVAIPTFVAYNYCINRVNRIVLQMERSAMDLVNFMAHLSEGSPIERE